MWENRALELNMRGLEPNILFCLSSLISKKGIVMVSTSLDCHRMKCYSYGDYIPGI